MSRLSDYSPTDLHPGRLTQRRLTDAEKDALIEEAVAAIKEAKTWRAMGHGVMVVALAAAEKAGALAV